MFGELKHNKTNILENNMGKQNFTFDTNTPGICSHCINQEDCSNCSGEREDCLGCPEKEDCNSVNIPPNCVTYMNQEDHLNYSWDTNKPLNKQVGGNHYEKYKIQPKDFILANELPFFEASIVKYACRHKDKGGKVDLLKAIQCCQILIKEYYE
jgi:hypothetical protein